jgi:hypothetical protein
MMRPALLILVPALAFPVLSYRTIVGDGSANAAFAAADAVVPPVPEAPVFDMREEETYSVILERPLFSPSRRPAGPTSTAAPADSAGLALLGVVWATGRSIGLFRTAPEAPTIKAREGDEVAGWQLVDLAPSAAILERQGGRLELELPFKAPAPVAASVITEPQPAAEPAAEPEADPEVDPEAAAAAVPQS